jgi:hypothetical protein
MPKKTNRSYKLAEGLQDELNAALSAYLDPHVEEWKSEVADGVIGEEARTVFAALGWLSSRNDSRLTPIDSEVE